MKKLLLILALCALPLFAAHAADPLAKPFALSAKDKADLSRIETYLNSLKNITADFLQVDDSGGMLRGEIQISRPGKMHVTYNPPSSDFMIADGSFVHIWNGDLKTQTNLEQDSSLAEFILRDPIHLSGDVTVTSVKHLPAKIEVTLVSTSDPDSGSLTLVFEDNPLKLRQWKVLDAQGHLTGVSLENLAEVPDFPENTFFFVPPNFGSGN